MFYAGDEFCNTQYGNNNAYCQDSIVSWLDWTRLKKYGEIYEYVRELIRFRKEHEILRRDTAPCSMGWPSMSVHNSFAWNGTFTDDTRVIGIMFAGVDKEGKDDVVFLAVNAYWESQQIQLPELPEGRDWEVKFNSDFVYGGVTDYDLFTPREGRMVTLAPRSAAVLCLRK